MIEKNLQVQILYILLKSPSIFYEFLDQTGLDLFIFFTLVKNHNEYYVKMNYFKSNPVLHCNIT